ncbi:MAG: FtsX-like permease family protein [Muribaculaceae bacterium]|nr:FtsX-like permease family protein [Muribaculaceae bacterium]
MRSEGQVAPAIAWRYLRSKKSHSAVGAISVVSICGMAVATAAIICVLSVFNGFRQTITDRLDVLTPDILVSPAKGKVFDEADSIAARFRMIPGVATSVPVLADNALAICHAQEMPVFLKGVTGFKSQNAAEISIGTAAGLGAQIDDNILLFAPRREGRVNLSNPAASFITDSVTVIDIFQTNRSEIDQNTIITDIETVRELLQYDGEASSIEINAKVGANISSIINTLKEDLGAKFIIKDRLQQQEMDFRMISIEKWITFLLLFFILVIASFNVISSLSMLVLDKEKSIGTLRALGFSRRGIGSVFFWQSVFVTGIGGAAGIALGVMLTLLQQHFGIIRLQGDPESLLVTSYPVQLQGYDILLTLIPVVAIGLFTAILTSRFAKSRMPQ